MNVYAFAVGALRVTKNKDHYQARVYVSYNHGLEVQDEDILNIAKEELPESEGWQEHALMAKIKMPESWLKRIAEEYVSIPAAFLEDDND